MKFTQIEPHENLDLMAWRSESGRWEIGYRSVMYGIRVSLSLPESQSYALDYCCGTDGSSLILVFQMLRTALLDFDDTVTIGEVSRWFPVQNCKPIENDFDCFGKLMQLGVDAAQKHQNQVDLMIDPHELVRQLSQRFQANRLKLIESWQTTEEAQAHD